MRFSDLRRELHLKGSQLHNDPHATSPPSTEGLARACPLAVPVVNIGHMGRHTAHTAVSETTAEVDAVILEAYCPNTTRIRTACTLQGTTADPPLNFSYTKVGACLVHHRYLEGVGLSRACVEVVLEVGGEQVVVGAVPRVCLKVPSVEVVEVGGGQFLDEDVEAALSEWGGGCGVGPDEVTRYSSESVLDSVWLTVLSHRSLMGWYRVSPGVRRAGTEGTSPPVVQNGTAVVPLHIYAMALTIQRLEFVL